MRGRRRARVASRAATCRSSAARSSPVLRTSRRRCSVRSICRRSWSARMRDSCRRCTRSCTEVDGNLLDRALLQVAQHQQLAIAVLQVGHGGAHRRKLLIEVDAGRRCHWLGRLVVRATARLDEQASPQGTPALVVARGVDADVHEPCAPRGVTAKAMSVSPRQQEHFLHDVVDVDRGLRPAEQSMHQAADAGFVAHDTVGEGSVVLRGDRRRQFGFEVRQLFRCTGRHDCEFEHAGHWTPQIAGSDRSAPCSQACLSNSRTPATRPGPAPTGQDSGFGWPTAPCRTTPPPLASRPAAGRW